MTPPVRITVTIDADPSVPAAEQWLAKLDDLLHSAPAADSAPAGIAQAMGKVALKIALTRSSATSTIGFREILQFFTEGAGASLISPKHARSAARRTLYWIGENLWDEVRVECNTCHKFFGGVGVLRQADNATHCRCEAMGSYRENGAAWHYYGPRSCDHAEFQYAYGIVESDLRALTPQAITELTKSLRSPTLERVRAFLEYAAG